VVESATVEFDGDQELVKLTFTGRLFHHHSLAPASVDRDVTTWNLTDLASETTGTDGYRTWENGIREYLLNQATGRRCGKSVGDAAWDSDVWSLPDDPDGACFPYFVLVQLPPLPHLSDGYSQGPEKSPILHDHLAMAELYTRVLCEGCVDTRVSLLYACQTGVETLMDYTEENLWFDAIGQKWPTLLGTAATAITPASDVRDDRPLGYGPAPATYVMAEQFNQLASAVNLLTKYRVMLPGTIELRNISGTADVDVEGRDPDGDPASCVSIGWQAAYYIGTPPDATPVTTTPWGDWNHPTFSATILSPDCGGGGKFVLETTRSDVQLRLAPDADVELSIPPNWSDMLDTAVAALALTTASTVQSFFTITSGSGTGCDLGGTGVDHWARSDGTHLLFGETTTTGAETCAIVGPGNFSAQALGQQTFQIGRGTDGAECNNTITNDTLLTVIPDTAMLVVPLVD
jgi:hypothetical protein